MKKRRDLTPFHWTLSITILFTLAMGVGYLSLVWLPPAIFLMICIAAAFFHEWGFYLPVISHGIRCDAGNTTAVALTVDDGPDPATTPALLELLDRHGVQATFFVLGKRVRAFPELVRAISEAGHTIGNHSFSHRTGIAFKSRRHLYNEVAATQAELARLGIVPRIYRPPVGITYPGMGKVLEAFGLVTVTFNRRALDFGNRRLSGLASRILARIAPGDIIMVHDLPPYQNDVQTWLAEIDTLIRGIREKHLEIRSLAEVIGRPDIQHTSWIPGKP
ncbi:polysaccharide deacetylase family protein [Desulfosarcina sp. OttesenSCG-928-G10]|nr:polysaccharide deacetylase family protein [Desulfosarcina sp. OttesenSCG-928-G10]MDL2321960.1 polysaccharide deacetylase family protein [Desulfosarcina sp. OttesenSCG-928-B08]